MFKKSLHPLVKHSCFLFNTGLHIYPNGHCLWNTNPKNEHERSKAIKGELVNLSF